jgi:hypothetical protein
MESKKRVRKQANKEREDRKIEKAKGEILRGRNEKTNTEKR